MDQTTQMALYHSKEPICCQKGLAVGLVEIEPDGDILKVFPHSGQ